MADTHDGRGQLSGLAVVALGCAVIWVFGLGSLLAVVLGHLARRRIRSRGQRGGAIALVALLLGYLGLVVLAVLLLQGGLSIEERTQAP